ncbi:HelD family protein [Carbonactinospora thermoautotrophica]|nr:ATP-binding domain-containing protein [Carbonactinospora thermoautotrophica]
MLYGRLDDLRERASNRLALVLREAGGTPQALLERDAAAAIYAEQLARFDAAENGLCFGRLDFHDGERRYIGRIGILDESADYEPLLVDWRAPAARPFYLATVASPGGVRRRRHIRTRHRKVVGLDDEVLDLAAADRAGREGLVGEAALLAALNASRTGRMNDIVETIQAEQDRIIRSEHKGVLVVEGGPGTGKTAVALHRAAFLLYTYRQQLSRRGVLIVGPNATFLRYIEQVLPSLGETGVLLSTIGELYPGISARRAEPPEVAEIKGRLAMADIVAAAVRDRQRVPDDAMEIVFEYEILRLDRETCVRARERARRSRMPHNQARPIFVREVIDALARQVADRLGADVFGGDNLLDEADVAEIRRELREDAGVQAALEELWPVLTPQRLLADLFSSAELLASAAPGLTEAERKLLLRDPEGGWTPADVPLLDEAAELLGEDDRPAKALAERKRRERIAYAQGVLDIAFGSRSIDLEDDAEPKILGAYDLLDADQLADRHEDVDDRTTAERAAADRTWTFGQVIVDEAQELSEMAWRMLMRRCRWMTLVGDVAQTGDLAGTSSWQRVLKPYVGDRWRLERLTVNYRTPAEIMAVAADVLAGLNPPLDPPRSVRESGVEPWRLEVPPAELADRLAVIVAREAAEVGDGRLAVIVPATRLDELGRAFTATLPDAAVGEDPELENPVVVLSVRQAKGLEFDSVLVVEPERILAESPRGRNDLYVALTRATQRLGVVHTGELPAALTRLRPRDDAVPAR